MTKVVGGSDTTGFFDGTKYLFETSTWTVVTLFRMLWTFGLDMFRINRVEEKFIDKFSRYCEVFNYIRCIILIIF